jgi:hypothetical protein
MRFHPNPVKLTIAISACLILLDNGQTPPG